MGGKDGSKATSPLWQLRVNVLKAVALGVVDGNPPLVAAVEFAGFEKFTHVQSYSYESSLDTSREGLGQGEPTTPGTSSVRRDSTMPAAGRASYEATDYGAVFEHSFSYDFEHMPNERLEGKGFVVRLFRGDNAVRRSPIGGHGMGLDFVWSQQSHHVPPTWLALMSANGNITAFILVSACLLGPGDIPPPMRGLSTSGAPSRIIYPKESRPQVLTMDISLFQFELNEPEHEGYYATVSHAGFSCVSSLGKPSALSNDVEWMEKILLPMLVPHLNENVEIEIFGRKSGAKKKDKVIDARISKISLSLRDIMMHRYWHKPRWIPVYAAADPTVDEGAEAFTLPSPYRGRLLLQVALDSTPVQNPTRRALTGNEGQRAQLSRQLARLDLSQATNLPTQNNRSVIVRFSVGSESIESGPANVAGGCATWNESLQLPFQAGVDPDDTLPDAIIEICGSSSAKSPTSERRNSLTSAGELLAYCTVPLGAGEPTEPKLKWVTMENHDSPIESAPCVLASLWVGEQNKLPSQPMPIASGLGEAAMHEVRVHVYQAEFLDSALCEGRVPSPAILVRAGGGASWGPEAGNSFFPAWYTTITLKSNIPTALLDSGGFDVDIMVMDRSTFVPFNLGSVHLVGDNSMVELTKPSWHTLEGGNGGKLLVSVQIVREGSKGFKMKPPSLKPRAEEWNFHMAVSGLHSLVPLRNVPISNPFIEVETDGMAGAKNDRIDAAYASKTSFSTNECVTINVRIPEDPIFLRPVVFAVYDERLGGMSTPLVGTAVLPLESIPTVQERYKLTVEKSDSLPWLTSPRAETEILFDGSPAKDSKSRESHKNINPVHPASPISWSSMRDAPLSSTKSQVSERRGTEAHARSMRIDAEKHSYLPEEYETAMLDQYRILNLARVPHVASGSAIVSSTAEYHASVGVVRVVFNLVPKKESKKFFNLGGRRKSSGNEADSPLDVWQYAPRKKAIARIYVLCAYDIVPTRDMMRTYVSIDRCGDNVVEDRGTVVRGTNPEFHKVYEVEIELPHDVLAVTLRDDDENANVDGTGRGVIVGTTYIDAGLRHYSRLWSAYTHKPVEVRQLYHPSSTLSQGKVEVMVEIMNPDEKIPITPFLEPPVQSFELRVVVYSCSIPLDAGASDYYIVGWLEGLDMLQTDMHEHALDGDSSFNWRWLFPVELPTQQCRFFIEVWRRESATRKSKGPNQFKVSAKTSIMLAPFFGRAQSNNGEIFPADWFGLSPPHVEGGAEMSGHVMLSFEAVPADEAAVRPAGMGRDEPNQHPVLPEPERFAPPKPGLFGMLCGRGCN